MLGNERHLKREDVPGAAPLARVAQELAPERRDRRAVEDDEPLDDLRPSVGRCPCGSTAPVVPDDDGTFAAEGMDEPGDVTGQRGCPIRAAALAATVSAQVGCDGTVPGVGERGELVAPRARELWEAVEEENEWAARRSGRERVEADPVRVEAELFHIGSWVDD
jgi:hypothetical protein